MFKVASLLIVVLLSVQGLDTKPVDQDEIEQLEFNGIAEEVAEALKRLIQKADPIVANGCNLVTEIESEIKTTAKTTLEKTEENIIKEAQKLNDKMNEIIEKAEGKNITKCLEEYQPKLAQFPLDLTDELKNCVNKELYLSQFVTVGTLSQIYTARQIITKLEQEAKDCNESSTCLSTLLLKINKLDLEFSWDIRNFVTFAQLSLSGFAPSMGVCAAGKAETMVFYGENYVADLAACVMEA